MGNWSNFRADAKKAGGNVRPGKPFIAHFCAPKQGGGETARQAESFFPEKNRISDGVTIFGLIPSHTTLSQAWKSLQILNSNRP
jgi:hypothetical protein